MIPPFQVFFSLNFKKRKKASPVVLSQSPEATPPPPWMAAERGNCCTCCLGFIISAGLTALFLWLSLRTDQPKCSLESLYLPFHNNNNTIIFMLKFANDNKDKGIKYDAVQVAFKLFVDANTTKPVANATVEGFYQGHEKTAKKFSSAEARGGVNRTKVDGRLFLRVEFATAVKYKIWLWYTKRHRLWGGANVEVNVSSGEKVNHKGIRLGNVPARVESEAAEVRGCCRALLIFLVSVLLLMAFT